jgi:hypothetical protein
VAPDVRGGAFERVGVAGEQRNVGALLGEPVGDREADPAAAAGDEGPLARQLEIHSLSFLLRPGAHAPVGIDRAGS